MSVLIPRRELDAELSCEMLTAWLDEIIAAEHRSHRTLLRLEENLEHIDADINETFSEFADPPRPAEKVMIHRLNLRCAALDAAIEAKWRHPRIRRHTRLALARLHRRHFGVPDADRYRTVIFETSSSEMPDIAGYTRAWRIEPRERWVRPSEDVRWACPLQVLEGPLWVHDLYRHLSGAGEEPGNHPLPGSVDPFVPVEYTGAATAKPDEETLEAALVLWAPETPDSPYRRLCDAIGAAALV